MRDRARSGYNNHMARSSIVGARELKTRLGSYLERVRRGETLLITDRNHPVAELRPVSDVDDPAAAALRRLAARGLVTLPSRAATTTFAAIVARAGSAARAVTADRDERG